MQNCPLCNNSNIRFQENPNTEITNVSCPSCGNYMITREAIEDEPEKKVLQNKYLLSGLTRTASEKETFMLLKSLELETLVEEAIVSKPDQFEAYNIILNYVKRKSAETGELVKLTNFDYPLIYAKNGEDFMYLVRDLLKTGYIETPEKDKYRITLTGLEKLTQIVQNSQRKLRHHNENNKNIDWDFFISHASEDKDSIARPLANTLSNEGFRVWYDEFSLTLGDSLRRSIDKGLSKSKFGIVILSQDFFNKEWPQKELDGLVARENAGVKVILPLWHNVTQKDILNYSPILADKLGVSTSKGIEIVVLEIKKVYNTTQNQLTKEQKIFIEPINTFPNGWLTGKLPNLPGFTWISIGIILPIMKDTDLLRWNSTQIDLLRKAIEEHRLDKERIWTQKWCPLPVKIENIITKRDYMLSARLNNTNIARIVTRRLSDQGVWFYPEPIHRIENPLSIKTPEPERGEWFQFWFDARGYMLASIGFPWNLKVNTILAEDACRAFYAIIDLFTQDKVKNCFPNCAWESGRFIVFAKIEQFPGSVDVSWDEVIPPEEFYPKGSSWSGPHETIKVNDLNPERVAKYFTDKFLAWSGFLHYEKHLESFILKND